MMDEMQEGLVKREESSWGKNALEVKGNFSWGFINKQEDAESGEEDNVKATGKVEDKDEVKDHTIGSKMTLKNLNLSIKEGEFVCIIGDVGVGKTSLL